MSLNRRNPRRDRNEAALVKALRQIGAVTWRVSGPGLPDLLVGFQGRFHLLEVKGPRGRLTPEQELFHATCTALKLPAHVVKDLDQALAAIGAVKPRQPPYPDFCSQPAVCSTDGRCHRDPCCID